MGQMESHFFVEDGVLIDTIGCWRRTANSKLRKTREDWGNANEDNNRLKPGAHK